MGTGKDELMGKSGHDKLKLGKGKDFVGGGSGNGRINSADDVAT